MIAFFTVCRAKFGEMTKFGSKIKKFEFISHMGMLYTILKEILYRFLFLSLKMEDYEPSVRYSLRKNLTSALNFGKN